MFSEVVEHGYLCLGKLGRRVLLVDVQFEKEIVREGELFTYLAPWWRA